MYKALSGPNFQGINDFTIQNPPQIHFLHLNPKYAKFQIFLVSNVEEHTTTL